MISEGEQKILAEKVREMGDTLGLLVRSLVPEICGRLLPKMALALALVSDVENPIHVLCMGDPGVGKSTLLKHLCKLVKNSTCVVGGTSCGLTLSVSDGQLSAGALVQVNQGIAVIDELDKTADIGAL